MNEFKWHLMADEVPDEGHRRVEQEGVMGIARKLRRLADRVIWNDWRISWNDWRNDDLAREIRAIADEADDHELEARWTIDRLLSELADAEAENAKLRELVDAWMGCGTRYHTMKGGCPMFDADAEDFCKAARLARKLGIEVEE